MSSTSVYSATSVPGAPDCPLFSLPRESGYHKNAGVASEKRWSSPQPLTNCAIEQPSDIRSYPLVRFLNARRAAMCCDNLPTMERIATETVDRMAAAPGRFGVSSLVRSLRKLMTGFVQHRVPHIEDHRLAASISHCVRMESSYECAARIADPCARAFRRSNRKKTSNSCSLPHMMPAANAESEVSDLGLLVPSAKLKVPTESKSVFGSEMRRWKTK